VFADRVRGHFVVRRPELADRIDVVPGAPIQTVPPRFDWAGRGRRVELALRAVALAEMESRGLRVAHAAVDMFDGVVVVDVVAGEAIIAPGENASFAVVPSGPGLVVTPLGGYDPVAAQPWIPVGTIGVLRGHDRNSFVTASRPLEVLVIPADVFLAHWAEPYDAVALVTRVLERPEP
jgi:CRP-like cAMP-binding protein